MGTVSVNAPKTPVTKGSNGVATATLPNVCKMPPPPPPFAPTPLPNIGQSGKLPTGYSKKVTIEGQPVAIRGASFGSTGDIASKATGGGIVSSNAEGPTKFIGPGSLNVQIEGKNVQLLGDPMLNNCAPSGSAPNAATMMGIIQASGLGAADAGSDPEADPGIIAVKVVDTCHSDPIADAKVTVEEGQVSSDAEGMAVFRSLTPSVYQVEVVKKFLDGKFSKFLVQYPRIMTTGKTESRVTVSATVLPGETVEVEAPLVVYRLVADVTFHRRHIHPGSEDKYGHWWVKMGNESYGWWPKYKLGDERNRSSQPPQPPPPPGADAGRLALIGHMFSSAVYRAKKAMFDLRESAPVQTVMGVQGDLNGSSFGGRSMRDPHHVDFGADEQYQPIVADCRSDEEIVQAMRDFATSYSGNWSWLFEAGNHCHTFQKAMMARANLTMYKVVR